MLPRPTLPYTINGKLDRKAILRSVEEHQGPGPYRNQRSRSKTPQLSAHPGCRRTILSDPRRWALNEAGDPIDVPLCFVIVSWALIWGLCFYSGKGYRWGGWA